MRKYTLNLIKLASAIQDFEGWFPPSALRPFGSASFRNNNPGNIRWGNYAVSLGAIKKSPGNYAIFPDYAMGFGALCSFISDACNGELPAYNPNKGLDAFFMVYAPFGDNNNPIRYANVVANKLGVEVGAPIKNLLI